MHIFFWIFCIFNCSYGERYTPCTIWGICMLSSYVAYYVYFAYFAYLTQINSSHGTFLLFTWHLSHVLTWHLSPVHMEPFSRSHGAFLHSQYEEYVLYNMHHIQYKESAWWGHVLHIMYILHILHILHMKCCVFC